MAGASGKRKNVSKENNFVKKINGLSFVIKKHAL